MGRPSSVTEGELLWEPGQERIQRSRLTDYVHWLGSEPGGFGGDYQRLWEWSTRDLEGFWGSLWRYFEVPGDPAPGRVLAGESMPGAKWFPGASLNYAECALARLAPAQPAVLAYSEGRPPLRLSGRDLAEAVGGVAAELAALGVGPGDRVAAFLPNIPEALIACLASVSLGAIWSSCSPDFGEKAVLDRFRQIEPKVLLAVDGYRYAGRDFDRRALGRELLAGLPTVASTVEVPYLFPGQASWLEGGRSWAELTSSPQAPSFARVPFDHPLWILYSSGTTGPPKPIVQSHGGIVLEHLKVLGLHADLRAGDRSFWFSTTGWMMWNYLISGLLLGSSVVLYDGSPAGPGLDRLWSLAEEAEVTHFGSSAGHLGACAKAGLRPGATHQLERLRFLGSTGSPLAPASFAWLYRAVKEDLWVASLSGGTDLCTAFVLGCPWLAVRAGVIQCRGLGALVEAWDAQGRSLSDEVGELVLLRPMPSMPIYFWGDAGMQRYRQSYFGTYPGVWRHGDWIRIRPDRGVVIYGRSDATINRHGVRMGSSEIYQVVEQLPQVADSLVLEVASPRGGSRLLLFVVPGSEQGLGSAGEAEIRRQIREQISPRHVPDLILEVARIPRTLSGKKLEVPVKRILEGADPEVSLDVDAVDDRSALGTLLERARSALRREPTP